MKIRFCHGSWLQPDCAEVYVSRWLVYPHAAPRSSRYSVARALVCGVPDSGNIAFDQRVKIVNGCPPIITLFSPDMSFTNWNQVAWLVAARICATRGFGAAGVRFVSAPRSAGCVWIGGSGTRGIAWKPANGLTFGSSTFASPGKR